MKTSNRSCQLVRVLLLTLCSWVVTAVPATASGGRLTLRLSDAEGVPGGLVAMVVRTYESKGVGQGQACIRANSGFLQDETELRGADSPFADYIGSAVFATEDDALHDLQPMPGQGQGFLMEFSSESATINESDGPLAVVYLRLRSDLTPGQRFRLALDLQDTFLMDAEGNPIPLETRGGELTIRAPGSPIAVEADADDVRPGGYALVSFETVEPIGFSEGEVVLLYEAEIADGDPLVVIAPKFGGADFEVDNSLPGRTVVSFASQDASLNRIPGGVIQFYIPTRSDVPLGTESLVRFDPIATQILDKDGQPIAFRFESDEIEFEID